MREEGGRGVGGGRVDMRGGRELGVGGEDEGEGGRDIPGDEASLSMHIMSRLQDQPC